ncbi:7009_t:CDS:2, partial [Paraglomus occultum]
MDAAHMQSELDRANKKLDRLEALRLGTEERYDQEKDTLEKQETYWLEERKKWGDALLALRAQINSDITTQTQANGQSCFHRVYPGTFGALFENLTDRCFSLAFHSVDTLETKAATISKTKVNELPKSSTADDQQVKQMPDYKAMTKTELTKMLSKYGVKPGKREDMINMLTNIWYSLA